jgi:hypothetical protein
VLTFPVKGFAVAGAARYSTGVDKMPERPRGPSAIGEAPAGCLSQAKEFRRLPGIPPDSLVHLAATGVVGVAVAGALFAVCFSLLAPPVPVRRAAPVSIAAGPSLELARTAVAAVSPAAAHAPLAPSGVSSVPAAARASAAATALSTGDIARAIARGDAFFRNGDLGMARFFFQLAADAGDRLAALRLGATFDPASLTRWPGRGDPTAARYWYERAIALGAKDAASRLARLDAATSR